MNSKFHLPTPLCQAPLKGFLCIYSDWECYLLISFEFVFQLHIYCKLTCVFVAEKGRIRDLTCSCLDYTPDILTPNNAA